MSNKRRERLLGQVTRLREIEHRAAAAVASAALSDAARSRHLADRAAALVAGYRDLTQVTDVQELAARRFAGDRMRGIAAQTGAAADNAAIAAEMKVAAERQARRKREAIEEARARLLMDAAKAAPADVASGGGLARFLKNDPANHRGA
jgi:hypothetical protein